MSKTTLTRRTLLGLGIGGGAIALAGCRGLGGGSAGNEADGTINVIWWGDANRAEATEAMLDIYREQNPDVTISTEYQDSGPYQDRMATRFAAGDIPDVFNQRRDGLREYADRDTLLDLNQHSDILDLSDVPETYPLGAVDGALYGIPAGLNAVGFVIDRNVTERFGIEIPDDMAWSWEDMWSFSQSITEAAAAEGEEIYGLDLGFGTIQNLIVFVRQTGEDLYTEDGLFGASEDTLAEWFEMSLQQRESGGLPPAGFIELAGNSAAESAIAAGDVAAQAIPTNNLLAFNEAAGGNLQLCRFPGEVQGARRGHSIDTSMYWSIGEESPNREGALSLLNFMVNDVDGNMAVGTTRGLPCSEVVAEAILDTLTPEDQRSVEYILELSSEDLPPSRPDPAGGSAVQDMLTEVNDEITFDRITPQEAAQRIRAAADSSMGLA